MTIKTLPRLIDQLASLTALRDVELLEFSLLKTLHGFLQPQALSMIRLDSKGQPFMEIIYQNEQCSIRNKNLVLSNEVQAADGYLLDSEEDSYTIPRAHGVTIFFALLSMPNGRSYLQLSCGAALSRLDNHLVAGILQIYRNFCSLMQHAQTDQLTGLANRTTFDDCITKVYDLIQPISEPHDVERREGESLSYWLVMVDIDHFKQVNDRFGHPYGDEVLVLLAQLMKKAFRDQDMIFRFGGEEFVLIIACPSSADCRTTLERFRLQVEQYAFPQIDTLTVSIGVTQMLRETFAGTLLDYADQALYYGKRNGRNQVVFFEDLVAQGLASPVNIQPGGISFF